MEAIARVAAHASAAPLALVGLLGLSAGIHAALFAAHVGERPVVSVAFLAAAFALVGAALGLSFRPGPIARVASAALLAALLLAYVVFRHEPFDAVAAISKAAEAAALGLALGGSRSAAFDEAGTPVGILTLALAAGLFLAGGHGH
jgi:hypothetical protein